MLEAIQSFHQWLQENYSSSDPHLTKNSSGQVILELKIKTETYAMEYFPAKGFALSKISSTTFGWEPVGSSQHRFSDIKADLIGLLNE